MGGRVQSATTKLGSHLDIGGQWIGHGHHRITALVEKARGTTYQTFSRGLPTIVHEGCTMSLFSLSVLLATIWLTLRELASRMHVPRAWITLSVDKAIEKFALLEIARHLLRLLVAVSSTAELSMYSLYSHAKSIPLSGGLLTMLRTQGGAQDRLVVESMGITTSLLASELPGRILTDIPVTSVSQNHENGVTVRTASGELFHASKVIITVPPPMLKSITFDPPMPPNAERFKGIPA